MKSKFFSIIIATYNIKHELIGCINSISNQNFSDYELLISDGGSVDGTSELISSTEIKNLTWYKSAPDKGIYDALNMALDRATGRWILVLGADDRLAGFDALFRAHSQIKNLGLKTGIAYSDLYIKGRKGTMLKKYPEYNKFRSAYRGGAFIHHQTAFVARESLVCVGKFSLDYKVHADYDVMQKVIKISGAVKIDGAYVEFNADGYSSKLSNLWQSLREIYTIRQLHGFVPLPSRLLITYCGLVIRRIFPFLKR